MTDTEIEIEIIPVENYGEQFKLTCYALYCRGLTVKQIARDVGVTEKELKRWVVRENWDAAKEEAKTRSRQLVQEDAAFDIAGIQEQNLRIAQQLKNVVENELQNYTEDLRKRPFKSWDEISRVLERVVGVEKNAVIGDVQQDLLIKIIGVIRDNVTDEQTRMRIAEGIKGIISKQ